MAFDVHIGAMYILDEYSLEIHGCRPLRVPCLVLCSVVDQTRLASTNCLRPLLSRFVLSDWRPKKVSTHLTRLTTSTEKFYSGGCKPIYSGVFRNRQC
jgi:hypothetical protein